MHKLFYSCVHSLEAFSFLALMPLAYFLLLSLTYLLTHSLSLSLSLFSPPPGLSFTNPLPLPAINFLLLFSPGDTVYMADDSMRQEYVHNEMGQIYAGSYYDMFIWYWNFAQVTQAAEALTLACSVK